VFEENSMDQVAPFSADWWQQSLGTWMAWNHVTVAFFMYIFGSIAVMGIWEYYSPGGSPRRGVFALDTTRGDRLFMSHLGTCFIFLGWLGFYGTPLWGAVAISIAWIVFVFRYA
jgi:predicted small integral membrane protein